MHDEPTHDYMPTLADLGLLIALGGVLAGVFWIASCRPAPHDPQLTPTPTATEVPLVAPTPPAIPTAGVPRPTATPTASVETPTPGLPQSGSGGLLRP